MMTMMTTINTDTNTTTHTTTTTTTALVPWLDWQLRLLYWQLDEVREKQTALAARFSILEETARDTSERLLYWQLDRHAETVEN